MQLDYIVQFDVELHMLHALYLHYACTGLRSNIAFCSPSEVSTQTQRIFHTNKFFSYRMMPLTVPAGKPCVAVVFARLTIAAEDHGIRPFIVTGSSRTDAKG